FLQSNAHILNVDADDLEFQNIQPIMYNSDTGEYKFTGLNYNQYKNSIPVFRSRLILLVRNEENYPLVYASVDLRNLEGFIPDYEQINLDPEGGINNALNMKPNLVFFTPPELVIWAGVDSMNAQPKLAYNFIGDNGYENGASNPEKYLFVTDAENGEILYYENLIINVDVTGNVQGMVTQDKASDNCEEEQADNLMWARVGIGGNFAYADKYGNFTIPNEGTSQVAVQSALRGKWFRVYNQAGPDTVLYETVTPPGPANFMHNELNDDEYKRAEVNGYIQSNIVRDFTIKYNPDYPGLDQNEFPVNVNIDSSCNAYYDYQSINFFRAGGGCPNTAYSTIVHHEYGHHLVAMAGSGQGQYGEGMSDVMGVLITDDPGLAWGFYGECDTPLRSADNDMQYPCGGAIHYCGQLLSGCVWDTRNELNITNPTDYTDIISNLAVNAILLHTGTEIDPSITIDYLVLDDDNDNITDGTPHYWEIATGFGAHNMNAPPTAPRTPDSPDGPDYGVSYREFTFSASTIDCDREQIYYMFDWGDGEDSGWIGPYNSGETVNVSHIWTKEGTFEVRVKAKDEYDRGSDWSEPLSIQILPLIELQSIEGGLFKVKTTIKSNDVDSPICVQWNITLDGGAFIGKQFSGEVEIPTSGEVTIESGFILGFGKTRITITFDLPECSYSMWRGGFIYLIYVHVNIGGE
ncbi:MAG: PKD domain-containing protein, partial [Thermoplasmatales archaeon]